LPAVRVPRELQSDPRWSRVHDLTRLVGEEHQLAIRARSAERTFVVGSVSRENRASCGRRRGEVDGRGVADRNALVAKRANAESLELGQPFVGARVVLLVASDEVHPVAGLQLGERRDLLAQGGDAAVDQIAGDDDRIRLLRIAPLDDVLEELLADGRPRCERR